MEDQYNFNLNRKRKLISIVESNNEYKNAILPTSPPTIIISDDEDSNKNENNDDVSSLYGQNNTTLIDNYSLQRTQMQVEEIQTDCFQPLQEPVRNIFTITSTVQTKENTNNISSGSIPNQASKNELSIENRNILNHCSTEISNESSVSTIHSYYNNKKLHSLLTTQNLKRCLVLDDSFENALSILETERPPFSVKNKINNWITDCTHLQPTETEDNWSETNNSEINQCQNNSPQTRESENYLNSTPIVISSAPSSKGTDERISPIQSPINLITTNAELHCKGIYSEPNFDKKSRLIETRIDYENVDLSEQRKIIFKTPISPQKYLQNRIPKTKNGCQKDFFDALGLLNTTRTKLNGHVDNASKNVKVKKDISKLNNSELIDSTDSSTISNHKSNDEASSLKVPEIQIVFQLSSGNETPIVESGEISSNESNTTSIVEKTLIENIDNSEDKKIKKTHVSELLPDKINKSGSENILKLHQYFESSNRYTILSLLSDVNSIYKRKHSEIIVKDGEVVTNKIGIVEKIDNSKTINNNFETINEKDEKDHVLTITEDIKTRYPNELVVKPSTEVNKNEADEKNTDTSVVIPDINPQSKNKSNISYSPKKIKNKAQIKRKKKWANRKVKIICSSGLNKRNLRKKKVIQIIKRRPKMLNVRRRKRINSDVSVNLCNSAKLVHLPSKSNEEYTKPLLVSVINHKQKKPLQKNIVFDDLSKLMINPLKSENGEVLYAFYEQETLIIVQMLAISFWKYCKILKVLGNDLEWTSLGNCVRRSEDNEIDIPYKNRICMHDSMPIYTEMRAKLLLHDKRKCNLSSVYINIYYFHKDKEIAVCNSIQLDTIKCTPIKIMYTTISESRYFIMCWKQEVGLGKTRTGLCKYSLTPDLDTLASIREFKQIRHSIEYLESVKDDKLVGFGESEITIWDHRTGDILLNIDLGIPIGMNVGSIYCPSDNIAINNILIICQLSNIFYEDDIGRLELKVLAISMCQQSPSYRYIYNHILPDSFQKLKSFINTGEYIILTSMMNDEVWICCNEPHRLIHLNLPASQRFYSNDNSKIVEVTDSNLIVDTLLNQLLQFISKSQEN